MADKADKNNANRKAHPRSGVYRQQPTGYRAFVPKNLPLKPQIDVASLEPRLSRATLALGRLDGIADLVPNPDLFVAMYVRKEAVLSSQIEGTQASLSDVLAYESGVPESAHGGPADVSEVYNYVRALNHGLDRLPDLPLSLRLLKEIHSVLMEGVRGGDKQPGEFRRSQNWLGPEGCTIEDATFIPPPWQDLQQHLGNLEAFIRKEDNLPTLIRCGVAHAQFEMIHPFLDGNGRLGRLLITLMLSEREVLSRPLLYLSAYFTSRKAEYYAWLTRVREEGDWEGWLSFYLDGVREVAAEAVSTAKAVLDLQRIHLDLVRSKIGERSLAPRLLERLSLQPIITVRIASGLIDASIPTTNNLVGKFEQLGLLQEITGQSRNRVFRYQPYLDLLSGTSKKPSAAQR